MSVWDNVEIIAKSDLALIERVVDTVRRAKDAAAGAIQRMSDSDVSMSVKNGYFVTVPHDLGVPELGILFRRVACEEFLRLHRQWLEHEERRYWRASENSTLALEFMVKLMPHDDDQC